MNWLVKRGVKKYALKFVNEVLAAHADNVAKARDIVRKAILKVHSVLNWLDRLDAKLLDNKITDDEADGIIADTSKLVEELAG